MLDLKNKYHVAGLVVTAVVIGAGVYIYLTKYRTKNTFEATDLDLDRSKGPAFVFFNALWCPHCDNMMEDWADVEAELSDKITLRSIESSDPEMANHQIPGFPTLRMFPRGIEYPDEYVDYNGPRKSQSIIRFVMEGPQAGE